MKRGADMQRYSIRPYTANNPVLLQTLGDKCNEWLTLLQNWGITPHKTYIWIKGVDHTAYLKIEFAIADEELQFDMYLSEDGTLKINELHFKSFTNDCNNHTIRKDIPKYKANYTLQAIANIICTTEEYFNVE